MKLLEAELKRDPDNVYFLFQLAVEHNAASQPEKAFGCLQKAFARVKPGDPLAPNIAVDFLYTIIELKRFEAGIEVVARAEKHLGGFPDFFLVRGLFFMNLIRSNPAKYVSELPKIEQSFRRCLALGEADRSGSPPGSGTFPAPSLREGKQGFRAEACMAPARFWRITISAFITRCLEISRRRGVVLKAAAAQGYEPAAALLEKISGG